MRLQNIEQNKPKVKDELSRRLKRPRNPSDVVKVRHDARKGLLAEDAAKDLLPPLNECDESGKSGAKAKLTPSGLLLALQA